MVADKTTLIAGAGAIASITLADLNVLVSITVGLVTIGYVVTKWILLIKHRRSFTAEAFDVDRLKRLRRK